MWDKFQKLIISAIFCALSLGMISTASARDTVCSSDAVTINADYPTARVSGCKVVGDHRFILEIAPEDEPPINHSPWYGFKVSPHDKSVRIELHYTHHKHRYWPKISHDGRVWVPLKQKYFKVEKKNRLHITLPPSSKPLFVSAQEMFSNAANESWMDRTAFKAGITKHLVGQSTQGRSIYKLESQADYKPGTKNQPTLFLVGRQHPPEVTGALAMMHFMDTVFADTELANRFRSIFNVIAIPLVNPDGVTLGHWRHNAAGRDLNRDWGPFEHVETQLMKKELDQLTDQNQQAEKSMWLFLDFHSTSKNVFYTQTNEAEKFMRGFTANWLKQSGERLDKYEFGREARHNIKSATSKNYVYKRFHIPAITYELGDETDRTQIYESAVVFAEEMMKILLEQHEKGVRPPHEK